MFRRKGESNGKVQYHARMGDQPEHGTPKGGKPEESKNTNICCGNKNQEELPRRKKKIRRKKSSGPSKNGDSGKTPSKAELVQELKRGRYTSTSGRGKSVQNVKEGGTVELQPLRVPKKTKKKPQGEKKKRQQPWEEPRASETNIRGGKPKKTASRGSERHGNSLKEKGATSR